MVTLLIQGSEFHQKLNKWLDNRPDYVNEVIISTWINNQLPKYLIDNFKIIYVEDPGSDNIPFQRKKTNYMRHILGVHKGLNCVNNKYVIKIRSDIIFNWNQLDEVIFEKNILLSCNITSKTVIPMHVSDWFHISSVDNLKYMYDPNILKGNLIKYASIEEILTYRFLSNPQEQNNFIIQKSYKDLEIKSLKDSYKFMPLDLNILFRPNKKRLKQFNSLNVEMYYYNLNDQFLIRFVFWKIYQTIRFIHHKIKR